MIRFASILLLILGGAPMLRASIRVTVGGALAMAVTGVIGHFLGVTV